MGLMQFKASGLAKVFDLFCQKKLHGTRHFVKRLAYHDFTIFKINLKISLNTNKMGSFQYPRFQITPK